MFKMFARMFAMFETLFSAGEYGAKSLEKLAIYADESAGKFVDEARLERRMAALKGEREFASVQSLPTLPAAESKAA